VTELVGGVILETSRFLMFLTWKS